MRPTCSSLWQVLEEAIGNLTEDCIVQSHAYSLEGGDVNEILRHLSFFLKTEMIKALIAGLDGHCFSPANAPCLVLLICEGSHHVLLYSSAPQIVSVLVTLILAEEQYLFTEFLLPVAVHHL